MAVQLILASASPRRKELLERVGFSVKTVPADIDEQSNGNEDPEEFVKRMARTKVLAVVNRMRSTMASNAPEGMLASPVYKKGDAPARWVVGADTIVTLNGELMGKPRDQDHAFEMLQKLCGTEHRVVSGFCVFDLDKNKEGIQAVVSRVRMKRMTRPEIDKYLAVGESMDKAGGYAIQGVGSYLIDSISGSYTNVVGLPLCQLMEMFEEMGANDILPY